jgi:hypothetical protein
MMKTWAFKQFYLLSELHVAVYYAWHINREARLVSSADDEGLSAVRADGDSRATAYFGKYPVVFKKHFYRNI